MSEIKHKCYNSFSCILSVIIILFVVGSIMWDICITKPALRGSIEEIHVEIKDIHQKLSVSLLLDTVNTNIPMLVIPDTTDIKTDK